VAEISITDLQANDLKAVEQAAALLTAELGLPHWPTGYTTMKAAMEEVNDCLQEGMVVRIARDGKGDVVGWVGARPLYSGRVWELHPMVVRGDLQHRGIGRALVADLEAEVGSRGALTLYLGTDDEDFRTTLGGADLYDDLPSKLAAAHSSTGHPLEFYRRLGFTIVGVLPDADGPGKPDIFLAKKVG